MSYLSMGLSLPVTLFSLILRLSNTYLCVVLCFTAVVAHVVSITLELHVVSWTRHFCKVKTTFIYKNLYLLYTGSLAEQEIIFHSCRHKLDRQR